MDSEYSRTQWSPIVRIWIGFWTVFMMVLSGWLFFHVQNVSESLLAAGIALLLLILFCLFHSLSVSVSRNSIDLSFGMGLIRRSFAACDVVAARRTTTRWYHGWGIRRIRGGWLYNAWGFDAVRLEFSDGRLVWIGTDDIDGLLEALKTCGCPVKDDGGRIYG